MIEHQTSFPTPGRRPGPARLPARPPPCLMFVSLLIYNLYHIIYIHIYDIHIPLFLISICRIFATEKSDRYFPENLRSNRCFLKISRPRNLYGLSLRLVVLIRRRASAGVYNVAVARHFLFHRPKTKIVNLLHIIQLCHFYTMVGA